jgi:hypothetical protein
MRALFLFAILLASCEMQDPPKPVSVDKLSSVYSINHQPHSGVFNPQYLPNLKTNDPK